MNKLTYKQRKFVMEYLVDMNATKAAIRAGYSEHTARQIGQRLLTNVVIKHDIEHEIYILNQKQHKRLFLIAEKAIDALLNVLENGNPSAKVSAANSLLDRAGYVFSSEKAAELFNKENYEQSEKDKEEAIMRFIESISAFRNQTQNKIN